LLNDLAKECQVSVCEAPIGEVLDVIVGDPADCEGFLNSRSDR